jgi:prepilin-type N-terminal cleavage/methylation domain-containing protein
MNQCVNRKECAFSLIEMLVAVAVLSLMMTFMFNLTAQAIRTWEIGGRSIESAQAARIGMSYLVGELEFAIAGVKSVPANPSPEIINTIPFAAVNNATSIPGEGSTNLVAVPRNDQLFFVAPLGVGTNRLFAEVGYFTVYAKSGGAHTMAGQRYYLVRHGSVPGGTNSAYQDFYYRGTNVVTNSSWFDAANNSASTRNRTPLVDNCIQLTLEYASNNNGQISWLTNWSSTTNLPLGVLVTMRVLDAKSANRLAALRGDDVVTPAQLQALTHTRASADPVVRILREGTTTLRRFVPLVNSVQ